MSLKDWMKKVESIQLGEAATTVMVPTMKPGTTTPSGEQTALAIDTSKPGANVLAAALGVKPGQSTAVLPTNSSVKAVQAPTTQNSQQDTQTGMGNQAGLKEDDVMEVAPPGMEDVVLALKKKFPGNPQRAFATAWSMYNKKHGKTEESVMESKQLNEGTLEEIIGNHPHEHKMCQEGWGMDNSLFEALADHYFKEGRIPRSVWHGSAEELREFVESCYAKDTMGKNEDMINSGMLGEGYDEEELANEVYAEFESIYPKLAQRADERTVHAAIMDVLNYGGDSNPSALAQDVARAVRQQMEQGVLDEQGMAEGSKEDFTMNARQADPRLDKYATDPKPSKLGSMADKFGGAVKTIGNKVMNKLHPTDDQLRSGPLEEKIEEEMSELERSLRESTKEHTMFEGKKTKKPVSETTGVTDYNPKSQGGTRKELLAKYAKSGSSADATAARKAGATQSELAKAKESNKQSVAEAIELGDNELGMPKWYILDTNSEIMSGPFDSRQEANREFKTSIWANKRTKDGGAGYEVACGIEDDNGNFHEDDQAVKESVTKTKTGIKHRADAGGYGRKHEDDVDDNGKKPKAKSDEPKKGRGRPKNSDNASGEDKKFDTSGLNSMFGGKKPAKEVGKLSVKKRIKTKDDSDEELDESELKGKQSKLDINKNGKLDGGDFAILRGKKKKDAQMESWDRQLKGLLTEGLTVTTSVGNEGGNDTVSITASDADAHTLLQILQNAGMGSGVPSTVVNTQTMPAQSGVAPALGSDGGPATDDNLETPGTNVASMPMPRGMAFSVQPEETEAPTAPEEFGTLDQEEVVKALGSEQSSADDNGDDALAAIKKLMGAHGASEVDAATAKPPESPTSTEVSTDTEYEVAETDEDGKKPDEDGDGVPDWADKKKGQDDNADESESDEEKETVDEGAQTCNECGGLMEAEHECGQLNEWSNSPVGQSENEQFEADMAFMTKVLSGGLNGEKRDQTVMPHTQVKVSEGYNIDVAAQMKKLAGIK